MKRLLVANRGEIAVRIFCAARELDIHCIAIYCESDTSHITFAHEAVCVPNASSFLDVDFLVKLCQDHDTDAVHPGYGFLSESADFASRLRQHGIAFVGPSAEILEITGSKIKAKELARACNVPTLPALENGAESCEAAAKFADDTGYPIMLKAIDGGGGRGIRLVKQQSDMKAAFERAVAESPSHKVFAEKALLHGWRHVEVQILGDGENVRHYWERECSLQRRYQKVVELAPSMIEDRGLLSKVIQSAVDIAKSINYKSLGTFEFLVSPSTGEYYFMEINPRLQVEHTVTEACSGVDLVQLQLLVESGQTLHSLGIATPDAIAPPPTSKAIQLRVTAEDVRRDFSLSVGKIKEVVLPRGNGTRVDTHIEHGTIVSSEFDSLLAKIIVSGTSFESVVRKGLRALDDLHIDGITTNSDLLTGIVLSEDFTTGACDTQWLEKNLKAAIDVGGRHMSSRNFSSSPKQEQIPKSLGASDSSIALKKGDAWDLTFAAPGGNRQKQYRLSINKIYRNDFPSDFGAQVSLQALHEQDDKETYSFNLKQSESSNTSGSGGQKSGDPGNPAHLICPLSGQLVEMLVDEGDEVAASESVAIIRQMKMELEVRAHRKGKIQNMWDVEDGEDVSAGALVCEIQDQTNAKARL